jgi:hypothetical protein
MSLFFIDERYELISLAIQPNPLTAFLESKPKRPIDLQRRL